MPKCSFCKRVYEFPRGLTFVLNDGTVLYFCSSKCRKSWKMGRTSKKLKWIIKMKKTKAEILEEIKGITPSIEKTKEKPKEEKKKQEEKSENTDKKKEKKPKEEKKAENQK